MSLLSAITTPRATPRMGERSGATSMLPITTAVLLMRIPRAAMRTDKTDIRKKSCRGVLSAMICSIASFLSFSVKLEKRVVLIICLYYIGKDGGKRERCGEVL